MKQNIFLIILISLASTFVFGFIEACSFLFAEETFQNIFIKAGLDLKSSEILTSALSTAISIFAAVWIEGEIIKRYNIINHPIISSVGIIMGALFFVVIYNIYIKFIFHKNK